ncbi:BQ5605_C001g00489 [Microbotryum silenes-dioicae]|uniref:BQ5605_C001g00489 protein n=1 Tax=Microbotryum silenes-dioicae TaxID=796604 RepID=A0A2X0M6V9_9BASI|nr:BQ5605_C001g00489 [Microbotryum silenes-dioicae]
MAFPAPSPQPSLPGQLPDKEPQPAVFPILQLPPEILLCVIKSVDVGTRAISPTFPCGPSRELLCLSETSVYLHTLCRPLIWRSVNWEPQSIRPPSRRPRQVIEDVEAAREYAARVTRWKVRGMRSLLELMQEAKESTRGPIKIKALSYTGYDDGEFGDDSIAAEPDVQALCDILNDHGRQIQVIFLKAVVVGQELGRSLILDILYLPKLSALRLHSVTIHNQSRALDFFDQMMGPLPPLRTLQIMHGSPKLVSSKHRGLGGLTGSLPDPSLFCANQLQLVGCMTDLHSLLLWPGSRQFGSLTPFIVRLLPQLRLLSLDSVGEPGVFDALAEAFEDMSEYQTLPLEELFLEGRQSLPRRQILLESLSHLPKLQRLALFHLREAKPRLIADIAHYTPQLRALTLIHGDASSSVYWPSALQDYVDELKKLKRIEFFAWDRRSPPAPRIARTSDEGEEEERPNQLRLEYSTLHSLGKGLPTLKEAVCVTQDTSEASSGYFAEYSFTPQGARRVDVKKKLVRDFLVDFERWCIIVDE